MPWSAVCAWSEQYVRSPTTAHPGGTMTQARVSQAGVWHSIMTSVLASMALSTSLRSTRTTRPDRYSAIVPSAIILRMVFGTTTKYFAASVMDAYRRVVPVLWVVI